MNDSGKNVIVTFQQARRFCEEIARLLQTADAAMEERGWSSLGSQAVTGSSAVNKADEWLPYFAFRYYEDADRPGMMPFVGAIFDYYDDDAKIKLMETPLLSAGWYDYGADGKREGYILWHAVIHVYVSKWTVDGTLSESDPKTLFPKSWNKRTAARCRSFALPLLSLQNSEDLIKRVIDPLAKDIDENSNR